MALTSDAYERWHWFLVLEFTFRNRVSVIVQLSRFGEVSSSSMPACLHIANKIASVGICVTPTPGECLLQIVVYIQDWSGKVSPASPCDVNVCPLPADIDMYPIFRIDPSDFPEWVLVVIQAQATRRSVYRRGYLSLQATSSHFSLNRFFFFLFLFFQRARGFRERKLH